MLTSTITKVCARQILDSRGNPTVEAEVQLCDGTKGIAAVPSGASTGSYEAKEKRDGDARKYAGKGVLKAVSGINTEICEALKGMKSTDQAHIDYTLCSLDGTPDKSRLGSNAVLAVSMAAARAAAYSKKLPLWKYLGGAMVRTLPMPMMNVINGGRHAGNGLDFQEFMLVPVGAKSYDTAVRMCAEVCYVLKKVLSYAGVGDEGGFAPAIGSAEEALNILVKAIGDAGYQPGRDISVALDAAASEWLVGNTYQQPKSGKVLTSGELIDYYAELCSRYPICSIEDPLGEEDWEGWAKLTERLHRRIMLVGDDLFVTDVSRIRKGIEERCANAVLIKPNQIGTLTETASAVYEAKRAGSGVILSHRSGETEDAFIADLAVALECPFIKAGAPVRGERTAKYNQLLRISDALENTACFAGCGIC